MADGKKFDPQEHAYKKLRKPRKNIHDRIREAAKHIGASRRKSREELIDNDDNSRRERLKRSGADFKKVSIEHGKKTYVGPAFRKPHDQNKKRKKERKLLSNDFISKTFLSLLNEEAETALPENTPIVFAGTFSPFGMHHGKALRGLESQFENHPVLIGSTGQSIPALTVPRRGGMSDEQYNKALWERAVEHRSARLKTALPFELRQQVLTDIHGIDKGRILPIKHLFDPDSINASLNRPTEAPVAIAAAKEDNRFKDFKLIGTSETGYSVYHHNTIPHLYGVEMPTVASSAGKLGTSKFREDTSNPEDFYGVPLATPEARKTHENVVEAFNNVPGVSPIYDELKRIAAARAPKPKNPRIRQVSEAVGAGTTQAQRMARSRAQASRAPVLPGRRVQQETSLTIEKRAARAARYALRRKMFPNYSSLSIQQKIEADREIRSSPELHKLKSQFEHKYREKAAQGTHQRTLN